MKNQKKEERIYGKQSEKIINEGGRQVKIVKLVKYMENGEIKTEINKVKL